MKVSIFRVLRHYASVPTNLFQNSALAYGALNAFPQYETWVTHAWGTGSKIL